MTVRGAKIRKIVNSTVSAMSLFPEPLKIVNSTVSAMSRFPEPLKIVGAQKTDGPKSTDGGP